jgi:ABC-type Fe3+-hydroxamate transport system substrate-binding protein
VRQVGDARGRPVTLPERVDRVVSLVPSLTEWLVHAAIGPDLVLLPSEPYSFGAADAEEVAGWSGARVELVDGRALTWYGPRIPAALAAFRAC